MSVKRRSEKPGKKKEWEIDSHLSFKGQIKNFILYPKLDTL